MYLNLDRTQRIIKEALLDEDGGLWSLPFIMKGDYVLVSLLRTMVIGDTSAVSNGQMSNLPAGIL